ncbi:TIGR04219 family outer membrane beta-barrel protein [Kangiella sediminilitoris]|uniref:TIGR04219 family outer membrane beta-barrel protein n=1 Tax=Kangiella sediminilitoris TaxID=1144748 RepID=A0A1B3B8V0_9GAMM|nr:TIGR04219 family outer membrane beta-barrel protein [Kangiella sediminilitoris]AOE49234.1 hypothetical protein KS2013_510 [Kangiella sediminilitoris]
MTLKKLLTATTILVASGTASADFIGLYAGTENWNYDAEGIISTGGGDIDLNQDLGFSDNDDNTYYVAFEHPVPFLPNVKVQQTNLEGKATGTTTQSFIFNDLAFPQGSAVASAYDLSHTDYTLYYELLDNWVNLDLGLNAKEFDGFMSVNYQATSGTVGSTLDLSGTIPTAYGKAQFDFPLTGLSAGVTANIGEKSGDKISDIKGFIAYEGGTGFGVEFGYRTFDIEFDNFDSLASDIKFDGYYAGFTLHL